MIGPNFVDKIFISSLILPYFVISSKRAIKGYHGDDGDDADDDDDDDEDIFFDSSLFCYLVAESNQEGG